MRVKGHNWDPRFVTLASNHDSLLLEAVHVHKVILATKDNVLRVRRPADAQKSSKIRPREADKLECVVDEYSEVAVLRDAREVTAARWEGELVEAAFADGPLVQRVPWALHLARVDGEAAALLVKLVGGGPRAAHQLVVVDVKVSARVRDKKTGGRIRQPFDARHSGLVDVSLKRFDEN